MALSAAERTARARLAAYSMHARNDPRETTQKARETFLARFEDQVDPDRALSPSERERRAEAARKAHMARLTLVRLQARSKKKQTAEPDNSAASSRVEEDAGASGEPSD
jgi:hypothetical protein